MHTFRDFNVQLEEEELSNGIKVLLLRRKGSPICIETVFVSGSSFDPKAKEGLAHFTEHMLFAGSKSLPTKDKVASYIENVGGALSARTGTEILSVRVEIVDKTDLKHVSTILKEILTESLFLKESIERERKTIISEKSSIGSSPSRMVWELFKEISLQETPYMHHVIGDEESIKNITREDLLTFYKNMIVSGRAIVIASGDIEIDVLVDTLESGLKIRKTEQINFDGELPIVRNRPIIIKRYADQKNIELIIGFRTCPISNTDTNSLYIVSEILGGGRSSSLKRKMRYERGLVYSVGSTVNNFVRGGLFAVKTSVPKEDLQEALDIITEEFNRIEEGDTTKEELEFTKSRLIKSKKRKLQTSGSWVNEHITNYLAGSLMTVPDELNKLEKITIEDVKRVGKKYFKRDSWYLAMCGDLEKENFTINF